MALVVCTAPVSNFPGDSVIGTLCPMAYGAVLKELSKNFSSFRRSGGGAMLSASRRRNRGMILACEGLWPRSLDPHHTPARGSQMVSSAFTFCCTLFKDDNTYK